MNARILVAALFGTLATVAVACGSSEDSSFPTGAVDSGVNFDANAQGETGSLSGNDGGGSTGTCKPLTCADLGDSCGKAGDGCGNEIDCGTCTAPETCGGGGLPSKCGGTAACVPKTCADLTGVECGMQPDGCGSLIATSCGTCPTPEFCGGGGASKCGGGAVSDGGLPILPDGGVCMPRTVCAANECGPVADGCGGILTCKASSACPSGTTCGGGSAPSMCGAPSCTKATCASVGATCGQIADGCGGIVDCGGKTACTAPDFCGGGGANKCGAGTPVDTCVNFCKNQDACTTSTQKTQISGHVYAPNGTLPLPNALVYVPNAATTSPYGLKTFTDGIGTGGTCDTCSATADGSPLVQTKSLFDGSFTLDNVPVGVDFPLVIQLGRWRRLVTVNIPTTQKCTTVNIDATGKTRFPKTENEGNAYDNIPKFAISTGAADALECVLKKIGIDTTAEFKNGGSATGRVQFYKNAKTSSSSGTGAGATLNSSTPAATALTSSATVMNGYDAVIFGCRGGSTNEDAVDSAALGNLAAYANNGGRVFTTHYGYDWLDPLSQTTTPSNVMWSSNSGTWVPDNSSTAWASSGSSTTAVVSTTADSGIFAKWLGVTGVGALATGSTTTKPLVTIFDPRNDVNTPIQTGVENWIQANETTTDKRLLQMAFNTPIAATTQCGRVIYSDFHVSTISGGSSKGTTFPDECTTGFSAQEKILAYNIFNLTACITPTTPPPPPTCKPLTCTDIGATCGPAGDGCGNTLDCGTCPGGMICSGTPGACVTPPCSASSCPSEESCGPIPNGCGATVDCGPCPPGLTCGGGGPSLCGATTCTMTTCAAQGITCGPGADGCGGLLDCGTCPGGTTCGGGGTPGTCGKPNCTPRTCASAGANCGPIGDGCGGIVQCGTCAAGQTCGGGGTANVCSANIPR